MTQQSSAFAEVSGVLGFDTLTRLEGLGIDRAKQWPLFPFLNFALFHEALENKDGAIAAYDEVVRTFAAAAESTAPYYGAIAELPPVWVCTLAMYSLPKHYETGVYKMSVSSFKNIAVGAVCALERFKAIDADRGFTAADLARETAPVRFLAELHAVRRCEALLGQSLSVKDRIAAINDVRRYKDLLAGSTSAMGARFCDMLSQAQGVVPTLSVTTGATAQGAVIYAFTGRPTKLTHS